MSIVLSRVLALYAILAAHCVLSACGRSSSNVEIYIVDGIEFSVPKKHLTNGEVPWLSSRHETGFNFVLDPDSSAESHILVSVEQRKIVCRPDKISSAPLIEDACAGRLPGSPGAEFNASKSRKYADNFRDRWTYHAESEGEAATGLFATCFETGLKKKRRQCYSMGIYRDVIYSILYLDEDVGRLPQIRQAIVSRLSQWSEKA